MKTKDYISCMNQMVLFYFMSFFFPSELLLGILGERRRGEVAKREKGMPSHFEKKEMGEFLHSH